MLVFQKFKLLRWRVCMCRGWGSLWVFYYYTVKTRILFFARVQFRAPKRTACLQVKSQKYYKNWIFCQNLDLYKVLKIWILNKKFALCTVCNLIDIQQTKTISSKSEKLLQILSEFLIKSMILYGSKGFLPWNMHFDWWELLINFEKFSIFPP